VELQDYLLIWDSFDLVFESKRRIEKIYLSNLDFWGTNKTTFADTTTRRGITGGWNTVMTEQNNKDTATNNAINTLRTNINNHLNASNPHPYYYTKSEIDAKWKELWFVGSTSIGSSPNWADIYIEAQIPLIISGIKGTINKLFLRASNGNTYSYNLVPANIIIGISDSLKFGIYAIYTGSTYNLYIRILKNNMYVWDSFITAGTNLNFILIVEILEQN